MSLQYQPEEEVPDEGAEDIREEVVYRPPTAWYTITLVAATLVVFLAQLGTGFETSTEATAFDKLAFINQHEYWRILTGATVHGSLLHVAMNSYAFYSFGKIFEMLSNRAHLANVFLLAAIGGGLLSLVFMPDGRSVGASGGILGVVGYLAVYAFRRRQFISPEFRKSLLINIGFILVFGLVLYQQIDNFAHIGGLLTGAVYAFVQIPTDQYADPRVAGSGAEITGIASLGIYIAACAFSILLMLKVV